MNWDRANWTPESSQGSMGGGLGDNFQFSNIRHTFGEFLCSAPFSAPCRDMIEANKLTLQFYRQACRLIPSMINRHGGTYNLDYHKSKLNLGKWIRKGANIREPFEVTLAIRTAYDFLFACAYNELEDGYYNRFLVEMPSRFDEHYHSNFVKSRGLNLLEHKKFKNKSQFLRKFIKGTKPLLH